MGRKKKNDNQTLERQRELARERQRRRREKMSLEDLELKKAKDRERYAKLKKAKAIKTVKDMTPREHRRIKKQWRDRKRKSNIKKKLTEAVTSLSPPNSDHETEESVQKKRGRKLLRKDRSKCYRIIKKQEKEIEHLKRNVQKYKMRLSRATNPKTKASEGESPSPMGKVKKLVGREKISPQVKKQLFLGYALHKQLKTRVSGVKIKSKKQQLITKAIGANVLKKYRVQTHFKDILSYKMAKKSTGSLKLDYERKRKRCVSDLNRKLVVEYFEDDTVSKCCPGKKDYIVKNKNKRQRRVLLDHKKNLYTRFIAENGIKISYSTFSRLCPFWVTKPKASDRETCACIKHQNFELKLSALRNVKVISYKNPNEVLKAVVCDPKNECCMMGYCDNCVDKKINYNYDTDFRVKFYQWETVKEERLIKGKKKQITKTEKRKVFTKVSRLCLQLSNDLVAFKKHVYYQIHQSSKLKLLKTNLRNKELLFRIDFSENYVGKQTEEIQSAHFGASKNQMSLHTGVYYFKNNENNVQVKSFCTVSDQLDHQAHAVWAHLDPILKPIGQKFPDTTSIHFYSDGPSSQYKNRYNIYLMKTKIPLYFNNVQSITWNYTESGHGKGPMDGVGGVLKRRADEAVLHGTDITCARDFVEAMKERTKIFVTEVDTSSVNELKRELKIMKVPAIKNITQGRQVTWSRDNSMYLRSLTCYSCKADTYCDHYTIGRVFEKIDKTKKVKRKVKKTVKKVKTTVKKVKTTVKNIEPTANGKERVYHKIYTSSSEDEESNAVEQKATVDKMEKLPIKRIIKPKEEPLYHHPSSNKDPQVAKDDKGHVKKIKTRDPLSIDEINKMLEDDD